MNEKNIYNLYYIFKFIAFLKNRIVYSSRTNYSKTNNKILANKNLY